MSPVWSALADLLTAFAVAALIFWVRQVEKRVSSLERRR